MDKQILLMELEQNLISNQNQVSMLIRWIEILRMEIKSEKEDSGNINFIKDSDLIDVAKKIKSTESEEKK